MVTKAWKCGCWIMQDLQDKTYSVDICKKHLEQICMKPTEEIVKWMLENIKEESL